MQQRARLLIVEDEPSVRALLSAYLEAENFSVVEAASAQEAIRNFQSQRVDLVLLDLELPDEDGLVVARQLRAKSDVPIIFVTQRDDDTTRIAGLEIGGDDYVTKPFNARELLARIRNILKRSGHGQQGQEDRTRWAFSDLVLDEARRSLTRENGDEVSLTGAEFDLLTALVRANGRVLSRDFLLDAVRQGADEAQPKLVDVLVSRLRKKIEPGSPPTLIVTVKGHGYKLGASVGS